MTDRGKRSYHSPVRDRAAEQTRDLLRETARVLFVAHGYAPTTMKQIAAEAGVAERTLYLAFPTKAALLNEVIGVAIAGTTATDTSARQPDFRELVEIHGSKEAVAQFASSTTDLYERAGELLQLGEHAAGSDPELRAFAEAGAEATVNVLRDLTKAIADAGQLRRGTNRIAAADAAYALSHFTSHQLLRKRREWSKARYRKWLIDTLTRALLENAE